MRKRDEGPSVIIGSARERVRRACMQLLEEAGYTVAGVYANAGELLQTAPALHPDLALLDEKMEGLDGLTVSESLGGVCPCVVILSPKRLEGMTVAQGEGADNRYFVGLHFSRKAILHTMAFALASAEKMRSLERQMEELRQQQQRRRDINVAKGILMQELHIDEQAAHRLLQSQSMASGRSLEALVDAVLAVGTAALKSED